MFQNSTLGCNVLLVDFLVSDSQRDNLHTGSLYRETRSFAGSGSKSRLCSILTLWPWSTWFTSQSPRFFISREDEQWPIIKQNAEVGASPYTVHSRRRRENSPPCDEDGSKPHRSRTAAYSDKGSWTEETGWAELGCVPAKVIHLFLCQLL